MSLFSFHVVFRPEPAGGYTAFVPSLPGCITYGATLEEAEEKAQDAIEGCVAVLQEEGETIVDDAGSVEKRIQIAA